MAEDKRERVGWDLAVAAVSLFLVVLVLVLPERFPGARLALVPLILLSWGIYALFARPYIGIQATTYPSLPRSLFIQGSLILVLGAGIAMEPMMQFQQSLVMPVIWMTSRKSTQAILLICVNAVVVAFSYAYWGGFTIGYITSGIVSGFLTAAFSIALGIWITHIASWGTERQNLLSELTAAQAELEAASRESGAAEERARIARDLHDTLTQSVASIVMLAERARKDGSPETLETLESTARETLLEARALIASTTPPTAASGSLGDALRRLGARFERETGMTVSVSASNAALPRDLQVVLLRCAQEALANVRKHSGASATEVAFTVTDDAVLTVLDNGRGLDGVSIDDHPGFGLAGMRERMALVGGILDLGRAPQGGTVLTARIPLRFQGENP